MKRFTALLSIFLVVSPIGGSFATEISGESSVKGSFQNVSVLEEFGEIKAISINEMIDEGIKIIKSDPTISGIQKEEKITQLKEIAQGHGDKQAIGTLATSTVTSLPGVSYVKPAPGTIRIFISPTAVKVLFIVGIPAYAISILTSCGVTATAAGTVGSIIGVALGDTKAATRGFTMHGWNNYKNWNFRAGNTLAG